MEKIGIGFSIEKFLVMRTYGRVIMEKRDILIVDRPLSNC